MLKNRAAAWKVAVACVMLAATSMAFAQESPRIPYLLTWHIAPTEAGGQPVWVREQGEVTRTRLLPSTLFVADAEIRDSRGELLIPVGGQVLGVTADQPMACSVVRTATGRSARQRVCLIDSDGDGLFDTSFQRGMDRNYWVELSGNVPSGLQAIVPTQLRQIAREEMIGAPVLVLHYQRILDGGIRLPLTQEGGNMVRFHFKVGYEGDEEWLVRECRDPTPPGLCASAAFPSEFSFAGLRVALMERRGEDIRMQILSGFVDTPIAIEELYDGYNSGVILNAQDARRAQMKFKRFGT